jgi:uncharacterized membrane protein YcaP (DUF421 family)
MSRIIEGRPVILAEAGRLDDAACRTAMISEADLSGALRQHGVNGLSDISKVDAVVLEPSGRISVLKSR